MSPKEQLQELRKTIETIQCSDRKQHLINMIWAAKGVTPLGNGLAVAPASTSKRYHHCEEGGLIRHIRQVISIAECLGNCGTLTEVTLDSIITVGILHDLHKVCDQNGQPYYISNVLQSGKVSKDKPYKINDQYGDFEESDDVKSYVFENATMKPTGHLSMMTVIKHAPELYKTLTEDEKFAIVYHGGAYEASGYTLAGKENKLQILMHTADMLSSRYPEDQWH